MAKYRSGVQTTFGFLPTIAPTAPREGEMYYNDSDNAVYVYNGSAWLQIDTPTRKATGGTITEYSEGSTNYVVHTFTVSGTFTPTSSFTATYLLVGGGGGCTVYYSGGGGGGWSGGGGTGLQPTQPGDSGTYGFGNDGGGFLDTRDKYEYTK